MLRTLPLVLATVLAFQPHADDDAWSRVASFYHQRVQQTGIVGSSLMFVKGGRVVHAAFEGYQDRETKRRVDEDTIYHWASITKTFTGVAIMQLRDRGLLSLDDAAVIYVPELRRCPLPAFRRPRTSSTSCPRRVANWASDKLAGSDD